MDTGIDSLMKETQHKLTLCVVVRGVLDIRTRKSAEALSQLATVKVINVVNCTQPDKQENEPFTVRSVIRLGPAPGKISWRLLRVAYNLTILKLGLRYYAHKTGVFCENQIREALLEEAPDAIMAINADTLRPCAQAAEQLGSLLVYDAYEYWPDHHKSPMLALSGVERRSLYEAERDYMAQAGLAITVSPVLARAYQEEFNLPRMPLVIYNAPPAYIPEAFPVNRPIRFAFLGSFQTNRNMELMLEAAAQAEGVDFSFQGSGKLESWMRAEIAQRGLSDRIRVVEPVPYDELVMSAARYDVGVMAHGSDNLQVRGALPNKFFEYMAAGLGMIAPPNPALTEFEGVEDFACFLPEVTAEALAGLMQQLAQNPRRVAAMKEQALKHASLYAGEAQAKHLREAFTAMMAQRTDDV